MNQIENSLRQLGSHRLRQIFASGTATSWKSVALGVVTTALLQSSSMVSLMVQALAAAGLMPLINGVGIILGANLGTTLTGWLVALLGFKLSLDTLAIPLLGIASLGLVFAARRLRLQLWFSLLLGIGLLLFGLGHMKTAVQDLPALLPIASLHGQPAVVYLLVGTLLTAVIQSSSATMMIALAALHGGLLELPAAAALIIGADLGTTSTSALASIKGSATRKQLALAHVVFNLLVDLAAFIIILPALPYLLDLVGLQDPLLSLVAFHSIFNLIGLSCFLPFLRPFSAWVGSFFQAPERSHYPRLAEIPLDVAEVALAAFTHTVHLQVADVLSLNRSTLALSEADDDEIQGSDDAFAYRYESIKAIEGELLRYGHKLQQNGLEEEQAQRLDNLLRCSREAVFSAKSIKDIRANLSRLHQGEFGRYEDIYLHGLKGLYDQFQTLLTGKHQNDYLRESLRQIDLESRQLHESVHRDIITQAPAEDLSSSDLSTLLNINREVWQATVRLRSALELILLPPASELTALK
ncbi:Na/Pi cotransporter family protein [Pseudomaricurvus alcaniphilus]|nr:Na/Pi cotransporter family protein [Pseudomaricurvus alcaniphilus]